jgi:hypothetical protein
MHPHSRFLLGVGALFTLALAAPARAGGPIDVTRAGQPYRWDTSRPVRYALDQGGFGSRSHAWAAAAVAAGFQTWQEAPVARIQIEAGRPLTVDVTGRNAGDFLDGLTAESPSPILLDSDGSVLDELLGDGASDAILGFGQPLFKDEATGHIQVSLVVLNGKLASDFTDRFVQGVIAHELGHWLNMTHSQVNAEQLLDGDPDNDGTSPVMFYRGPNDPGGLHADDRAWFAWLYPGDTSALGSIRGRVLLPDGVTGYQGVHVIARRLGDPQATAVSAISGFLFRNGDQGSSDPNRLGEFVIPNLPPGSYTVEVQQLSDFPRVPIPAAPLLGGAKFWREGSSAQDPPTASTPIVVGAGQEVGGIDIVLNGESAGEPKAVAEQEPNQLPNGQPVSLPAVISGAVEDAGAGSGDGHDVYRVSLRDWTTVTAILSGERGADLDLDVLYLDHQSFVVLAESTEPNTSSETLQLRLPPGRYFFTVRRSGDRGSAYTLRLTATPSPEEADTAEAIWINYLIVGDVTTSGATLRWQTTGEAPSVVYYNRPRREVGSTARTREHAMTLADMPAGTRSQVEVRAASPDGDDTTEATCTTASPPAADGIARLVVRSTPRLVDYDLVEVVVRLSNPGDADLQAVRIEQVTPAPGWELLGRVYAGASLPEGLDVGRIGAGGMGALVVRLVRLRGEEAPTLAVHGRYSDAAGVTRKF